MPRACVGPELVHALATYLGPGNICFPHAFFRPPEVSKQLPYPRKTLSPRLQRGPWHAPAWELQQRRRDGMLSSHSY